MRAPRGVAASGDRSAGAFALQWSGSMAGMPSTPDPLQPRPGRVAGVARWVLAHLTLVLTALLGGAVVLALARAAAEVYESLAERDDLAALDQPVLEAAVRWRTPALEDWVTRFTDLGATVGMTALATVLALLAARLWRSWTPVLLMVLAAAGSLAITMAGKDLLGRTRPPVELAVPPLESSPSFPSGHTLNATALVGMAAYLLVLVLRSTAARLGTVAAAGAFVVAMGLSRVFLGHHWLTDVVAGWLLGLAWLATVVTAHRLAVAVGRGQRVSLPPSPAARPASSRATGTRNGEQET
ncbi:MAG TPA: phosphatase PAP2 family protein [Dermatophilaceae bacterium]|nr:phosphatase PAP2 family protein [Dermatophilaceae bacterium]